MQKNLDSATMITFGKVVSSPTPISWFNTYNAGKLFAVLSLDKPNDQEPSIPSDSLNVLGKELLSKLEEEFFTLDSKDLPSIKQAISNTFKDTQQTIKYSFAALFFSNQLYIFVIGDAAVFLKRDGKIARFEALPTKDPESIYSFLGKPLNNDLIVLTTDANCDVLEEDVFLENKDASEIAEELRPVIEERQRYKISLIVVKYIQQKKPLEKEEIPEIKKTESKNKEEASKEEKAYEILKIISNLIKIRLTHSKKVFLTIAIVVAAIFILSIYFAIKKQETEKLQALFQQTYPQAEKRYNEGNSLLGLNKNKSYEFFLESKKILEEAKSKFPKNSKEKKQFNDLLQKVEDGISISSGIISVFAKEADPEESSFINLQTKKPQRLFAKDQNNIYFADANSVYSISKTNERENEIIKNTNYWQDATALGVFSGNIYILDKSQNQILKFSPIQNGYGKSNYLASDISSSFKDAVSMAIDGSIFVLSKDGAIQKFTRGNPEKFTISGLNTPFSSPFKIFTDKDTSNIYILDNGNSRIVVLNKEGIYQNQYQTEVLKNAQDFEVLEKKKKIFVLSQNKVYEIEIK